MSQYFKYDTAIVRKISSRLAENALRLEPSSTPVNLMVAKKQKNKYVETLMELGLRIIEMEADEDLPDCVFVEDVVVVVGNVALLTQPGHPTRRAEVIEMRKTLKNLNLKTYEMTEFDEKATVDGGDVLFTGREFFVGLSSRTNNEGINVLEKVFSDFPVSRVKIKEGLHLKSYCSMASPEKILVATDSSPYILNELQRLAKFEYKYVEVKGNMTGANCLYIDSPTKGKSVVYQIADKFSQSHEVYKSLEECNKYPIDMEELSIVDGALTCCSILLASK